MNEPEHFERLTADLQQRWGGIDGALHAIAFAPEDALGGSFMTTPPESAAIAFQTSAYSLKALAQALVPLFDGGGSIVGLDFDATVAWPVYDWMGVAKAALESVSRYLARDLGPQGVRVNLVSAGPLETLAARGIPGFRGLVDLWAAQAPLDGTARIGPLSRACCYLLSDWSRGVSGEILHVDGGFHAMGAPLEALSSAARAARHRRRQHPDPRGHVLGRRARPPLALRDRALCDGGRARHGARGTARLCATCGWRTCTPRSSRPWSRRWRTSTSR